MAKAAAQAPEVGSKRGNPASDGKDAKKSKNSTGKKAPPAVTREGADDDDDGEEVDLPGAGGFKIPEDASEEG